MQYHLFIGHLKYDTYNRVYIIFIWITLFKIGIDIKNYRDIMYKCTYRGGYTKISLVEIQKKISISTNFPRISTK